MSARLPKTPVIPAGMLRAALNLVAQVEEHRDPTSTACVAGSYGAEDGPGIAAVDSDAGIFVVFAGTKQEAHDAAVLGAQLINGAASPVDGAQD